MNAATATYLNSTKLTNSLDSGFSTKEPNSRSTKAQSPCRQMTKLNANNLTSSMASASTRGETYYPNRVERKYSSEDEEEARNAKNAALEEKRQWEDMRREAQMKKMKAQEHIYPSGYMIPSGYMMH
ncbi:hypothetical protein ACHAWO_006530 [Cyclotella atomus]|uniref:TPX2 C-terminal domain-containing protein n=1 Tax=Cyclotella atomus TaxID=382360 RepID=A0ABD3MW65_9STRA